MLVYNQKEKEWKVNTTTVVAGWLICAATMLASMMGKDEQTIIYAKLLKKHF